MNGRSSSWGWFQAALLLAQPVLAQTVLVEAESFTNRGGWVVDQQFVEQMGSPFLLAHGMGNPVSNAVTSLTFPSTGSYRVWARTRDWVPEHVDDPGAFRVVLDGVEVPVDFGADSGNWDWQDGGTVEISNLTVVVELRDLTGFDGRCDALVFSADPGFAPTNEPAALAAWRRMALGLPTTPSVCVTGDVVVVGGGLAGCCAAIAAAQEGMSVLMIQDRPALGGNASSEIRVRTEGTVRHDIVESVRNFAVNGSSSSVTWETNRAAVVASETNIVLYQPWRAFGVRTNDDRRIAGVYAKHTQTGEEVEFAAPVFIDCTGDGWIGCWAGADFRMGREASNEFDESKAPAVADSRTLGNSLMWNSRDAGLPVTFPAVPWATNVSGTRASTNGGWNWEYGITLNTITNAEYIRDYLLRAIYGNFSNAKQGGSNANVELAWVPYVAGKRESRRLMGDHILTQRDVQNGVFFEDAVAVGSWSIDLHNPTATPYLSTADQTGVSPYYFPFRCLYSRSVPNLMMAGRCLSVSHVGLGSPRVMHTCGQMGVAVGKAASLCKKYGILPRDVYRSNDYTLELQSLIGGTWPLRDALQVVDNLDTNNVVIVGSWTSSTFDSGYYGTNYIHDGNAGKGTKQVLFSADISTTNAYRLYVRWTSGPTRATNAPIDVIHEGGTNTFFVNQRTNGGGWVDFGTYSFRTGQSVRVVVRNDGTTNYVVADAIAFGSNGVYEALDTDGDGLPNWWERYHFFNETNAAANDDADHDGMNNWAERTAGTDPTNAAAFLKISEAAMQSDAVRLTWQTASGRTYSVFATTNLMEGWPLVPLTSGISGGVIGAVTFTNTPDTERLFYRLRVDGP